MRRTVRNTGPDFRPLIRRGSRRAVPVCQTMMSIAPPLRRTFARRLARSRSSMLSARTSPARAAVSYSIRHSVFSRRPTSLRASSDSMPARDRGPGPVRGDPAAPQRPGGIGGAPALRGPVAERGAEHVDRPVVGGRCPLAPGLLVPGRAGPGARRRSGPGTGAASRRTAGACRGTLAGRSWRGTPRSRCRS